MKVLIPTVDHPTTQTAAKALPSAGIIPFLQTFYCDLTDSAINGPDGAPLFKGAKVDELYSTLAKVNSYSDTESEQTFNSALQAISMLLYVNSHPSLLTRSSLPYVLFYASYMTNGELPSPMHQLMRTCSVDPEILFYIGIDPAICKNVTESTPDKALNNLNTDQLTLLSTLAALSSISSSNSTQSRNLIMNVRKLQTALKEYSTFSSQMGQLFQNPEQTFCGTNGRTQFQKRLNAFFARIVNYKHSNVKEPKGQEGVPLMRNSSSVQAVQPRHKNTNSNVKKLRDSGTRIIFSPNTELGWSIIKEMNRSFGIIDKSRNIIQIIQQRNELVRSLLYNLSIADPNQTLVRNLRHIASIQRNLTIQNMSTDGIPSAEDLESTADLLDRSNTDNNLWYYTAKIKRDTTYILAQQIYTISWDFFRGFENEEKLSEVATNFAKRESLGIYYLYAGINFENIGNATELPPTVSYKISMNYTAKFGSSSLRDYIWRPDPENYDFYLSNIEWGSIFLQDLTERALIRVKTNTTMDIPGGYIQPFPFPCYTFDTNLLVGQIIIPLFIMAGNIFTVTLLAKNIVQEREKRLTDMLSVFGVGVVENWASWTCIYYLMLIPTVLSSVFLLKFTGVLLNSNPLILILVLLANNFQMISLSLLACIPFKRATLAASSIGLIYIIQYFIVPLLQYTGFQSPRWIIILSQFLPASALGVFFVHTVEYELIGEGIQWSNLAKSPFEVGFSIPLISWGFMFINTIVYAVLAFYLYEVVVGVYGIRKPFYFIVLPSYWIGRNLTVKKEMDTNLSDSINEDEVRLMHEEIEDQTIINENRIGKPLTEEVEPDHMASGVSIDHVSKHYSSGVIGRSKRVQALRSISLNLYEGNITALLGHNGAGKTTLMMILSGIFPQSAGNITIYGHSLEKERRKLQLDTIGLCPQHSILFTEFTVIEHFYFYGFLRGLSVDKIKKDSTSLLATMRLSDDKNKKVKKLSGGMSRKLSVCLAFLGSPKLVILDEPTAGVDPSSRAEIWNFLISERTKRCILLSTHHMDEAEVLGDRIALIDHGKLLCVGTLQYLKSVYNLRYTLVLEKKSESSEREEMELKRLIETNLIDCSNSKVSKEEAKFLISINTMEAENSPVTTLIEELEENKAKFGISGYGLSAPSLEQLFLMLTELHHKDKLIETSKDENINTLFKRGNEDERKKMNSIKLLCLQSYALFVIRFNYVRRDLRGLALRYGLFSLILIFVMIFNILMQPKIGNYSRLYPGTYLDLNSPQYVFIGASDESSDAYDYLSTMVCPGGFGVPPFLEDSLNERTCPLSNTKKIGKSNLKCSNYHNKSCWNYDTNNNNTFNITQCSCQSSNIMKCNGFPERPPQMLAVGDGSTIQDLIGYNITEYLTVTYHEYILKRYMGTSFGYTRNEIPVVNITKSNNINLNDSLFLEQLAVRNFSKAWFTFKGYSAMPVSLNLMNNAILRKEMRDSLGYYNNFTDYGIVGKSAVWQLTPKQNAFNEIVTGKPIAITIFIFLAFCFICVHPIILVLEEKSSGTKSLQEICGLGQTLYFTVNFISELLLYTIAVIISLIILGCFTYGPYTSLRHLPTFLIAVFGFGALNICLMQLLAKICKSPSTSYLVIAVLLYVSGISLTIFIYSLEFLSTVPNILLEAKIKPYFSIIPQFSFAMILYRLIIDYYYDLSQTEVGVTFGIAARDPFVYDPIGKGLLVIYIEFILLFGINIVFGVLNGYNISILKSKCSVKRIPTVLTDDSDVEEERTNVLSRSQNSENTLSLYRISKKYHTLRSLTKSIFSRKKAVTNPYAIEDVTFSVKNECFGLLGINGAGKTTIFNSITGVHSLTNGKIEFRGKNIDKSRNEIYKQLGYTPQKDALFDFLTGREHLLYYGRLKGVSGTELNQSVNQIIGKVHLSEYQNVITSKYSGGNKRKLATAIALISYPTLLLLDEPTSGVDPYAKQLLWLLLQEVTAQGISSLLTTHSMWECESLCSRIAILHNGHLECIGSPQHLKSKYGHGYLLKFYLGYSQSQEDIIEIVNNTIPQANIQEQHTKLIVFNIEREICLSKVLKLCLALKRDAKINDFSLGQYTLNDVFMNIIKRLDMRNTCTIEPNEFELQGEEN